MSSKIIFRYGAMGSGKSNFLISTYYNYINLGKKPIVIAPDNQNGVIKSRNGLSVECYSLRHLINQLQLYNDTFDVILVDEVQFYDKDEIDMLNFINLTYNIPIIAYGLKTSSSGYLFEGSKRIIEFADVIEEMPTLCPCGHKARFNMKFIYGVPYFDNRDTINLREEEHIQYVSVCRECYFKIKNGQLDYHKYIKYDNSEV